MLHVVLFQPEIPPNTGNIIRLCANTGSHLHLIRPLGFEWDDRRLRRAGLDYHEFAKVRLHEDFHAFELAISPDRVFAFSTRGRQPYHEVQYRANDALVFGPETRGLPDAVLGSLPEQQKVRLPMRPGNRSLNLSNTVAIAVYEAWRQLGFEGGV